MSVRGAGSLPVSLPVYQYFHTMIIRATSARGARDRGSDRGSRDRGSSRDESFSVGRTRMDGEFGGRSHRHDSSGGRGRSSGLSDD